LSEKDELLEVMQESVGREQGPYTCVVDKGMMMKVPWAVDDPNPLWRDEQYARQTRYGGLIASPYFVEFLRFRGLSDYGGPTAPTTPRRALPGRPANVVGGEEVEFFGTIRPGDTITIRRHTSAVKKAFSHSLKRDVVIETLEQTFSNQFGEVVATHKSTNVKT
jgi:acyl dehydratase